MLQFHNFKPFYLIFLKKFLGWKIGKLRTSTIQALGSLLVNLLVNLLVRLINLLTSY